MKWRPIIFSEGVEAVRNDRKTQTRRVVKPQPIHTKNGWYEWGWKYVEGPKAGRPAGLSWHADTWHSIGGTAPIDDHCLYRPGEGLWVREAWLPDPPIDGSWDDSLFNDGSGKLNYDAIPERFRSPDYCLYKADWKGEEISWRSPMFMPRWASRINLLVTAVRVERLHQMSFKDWIADFYPTDEEVEQARATFTGSAFQREHVQKKWDAINAKRGFRFEDNPWVFVVEFERIRD